MLRIKVLVSTLPLIAAAVTAKVELAPSLQPCIAVGADSFAPGSAPFADLHVAFTDDPALASVRVAIADSPEAADFVVVDDSPSHEDRGCGVSAATKSVAMDAGPTHDVPRIYLAMEGAAGEPADYRIYVRSSRFTPRQAAALLVAARN